MLAAVAVVIVLAQAEDRTQQPPPAAAPPRVVEYTDAQARAALTEYKRLPAKASLAEQLQALEALLRGSHATLVPVLVKAVADSRLPLSVRKMAAEGLGHQPAKAASRAVGVLLRRSDVADTVPLLEPLVRAWIRVGHGTNDWQVLDDLFRADYAAERVSAQKAIVELAGAAKEKAAVPLLLDNLDEPIPEDVHGAHNPPAEYWEARWKAWKVWREDVQQALQAITGQKFGTAAEARAWLEVNGRKLGIRSK